MNVTEAAYKFVSGRYALGSELRAGRAELMRAIEAASGGPGAAARELGVTLRTWERWRSGQIKKLRPSNALALKQAVRRMRLSKRREDRLRAAGAAGAAPTLTISGEFKVSNDKRQRDNVPVGTYLNADVDRIGPIVDAFLSGDDEAMTAAFQAMSDDYVAGEWLSIDGVTF